MDVVDDAMDYVGQEAGLDRRAAVAWSELAGLSCCQVMLVSEGCVAVKVFFLLLDPPLPWPPSLALPLPPSNGGLTRGQGVPRWGLLVLVTVDRMEGLPVAAVVAEVAMYVVDIHGPRLLMGRT